MHQRYPLGTHSKGSESGEPYRRIGETACRRVEGWRRCSSKCESLFTCAFTSVITFFWTRYTRPNPLPPTRRYAETPIRLPTRTSHRPHLSAHAKILLSRDSIAPIDNSIRLWKCGRYLNSPQQLKESGQTRAAVRLPFSTLLGADLGVHLKRQK